MLHTVRENREDTKEKFWFPKFQPQSIRPVVLRFQFFKDYIESYVRKIVTLILHHLYLRREKKYGLFRIKLHVELLKLLKCTIWLTVVNQK